MVPLDLWSYAPETALYEAAGPPDWLDELDLRPGSPFMKMATRTVDPSTSFLLDEFTPSELDLRNRLLDEQHDVVFAANPAADDASHEVLDLVRALGRGVPRNDCHPLEAAGRLVAEDLCLMVRRAGSWQLDAAALCFPSIWSLTEKLGQSTAGIHGPVPHYEGTLSDQVDRFFDGLRPGRIVGRRNLSVKPFPLLFLPLGKGAQPTDPDTTNDDGSPWWLRSEFQTLQRLPESGAILFTIKLQLTPASVLLDRPDRARDLLAMYQSWDPPMWAFKAATNDLRHSFLPWLAQSAG